MVRLGQVKSDIDIDSNCLYIVMACLIDQLIDLMFNLKDAVCRLVLEVSTDPKMWARPSPTLSGRARSSALPD